MEDKDKIISRLEKAEEQVISVVRNLRESAASRSLEFIDKQIRLAIEELEGSEGGAGRTVETSQGVEIEDKEEMLSMLADARKQIRLVIEDLEEPLEWIERKSAYDIERSRSLEWLDKKLELAIKELKESEDLED